jgi:hypothetical protein
MLRLQARTFVLYRTLLEKDIYDFRSWEKGEKVDPNSTRFGALVWTFGVPVEFQRTILHVIFMMLPYPPST